MQIITSLDLLSSQQQGAVVAIGNFDGVHQGHQALIAAAKNLSASLAEPAPVAVMTFEPHPRQVFAPEKTPFRLTTPGQKRTLMQSFGVEVLYELPFDRAFAGQTAEQFAIDLLAKQLGVKGVVVGQDFRFGAARKGDVAFLDGCGRIHGYQTAVVAPVLDPLGQAYSSTRVRAAIQEGDFLTAQALLGHPWMVEGHVLKGQQLGRTIDMPTANIDLGAYQRFPYGIYAMRVRLNDDRCFDAVGYLGRRPTVEGKPEWLEVHLFDFSEDLYTQTIHVELVHFIRGDATFDGLDSLMQAMHDDATTAKAMLALATNQNPDTLRQDYLALAAARQEMVG